MLIGSLHADYGMYVQRSVLLRKQKQVSRFFRARRKLQFQTRNDPYPIFYSLHCCERGGSAWNVR